MPQPNMHPPTARNIVGILLADDGALFAVISNRDELTCEMLIQIDLGWRIVTTEDLAKYENEQCVWLRPVVEMRPADRLVKG